MTCKKHCWEADSSANCSTCCHCGIPRLVEAIHKTPTIRCRCCGLKAPRKVVQMHSNPGNLMGLKAAEQNDLNDWMLLVFPYKDTYIAERYQGAATARFGVPFSEVAKVCPKCATTIMGTVVHLSDGPLSEEDL